MLYPVCDLFGSLKVFMCCSNAATINFVLFQAAPGRAILYYLRLAERSYMWRMVVSKSSSLPILCLLLMRTEGNQDVPADKPANLNEILKQDLKDEFEMMGASYDGFTPDMSRLSPQSADSHHHRHHHYHDNFILQPPDCFCLPGPPGNTSPSHFLLCYTILSKHLITEIWITWWAS